MMPQLKLTKIVILTCFLSFVGALMTTILRTNVLSYSFTEKTSAERPTPLTSTVLFDENKAKHIVQECITGKIVGVRPSNVATVDAEQLRSTNHTECDQHRRDVFSAIFHNRVWGKNLKVNFSASGKPGSYTISDLVICMCVCFFSF